VDNKIKFIVIQRNRGATPQIDEVMIGASVTDPDHIREKLEGVINLKGYDTVHVVPEQYFIKVQ